MWSNPGRERICASRLERTASQEIGLLIICFYFCDYTVLNLGPLCPGRIEAWVRDRVRQGLAIGIGLRSGIGLEMIIGIDWMPVLTVFVCLAAARKRSMIVF